MDTSRITMPRPTKTSRFKKTGFKKLWSQKSGSQQSGPQKMSPGPKVWLALGFVALLCVVVFYLVYTLQGFHGCRIVDSTRVVTAGRAGVVDLAVSEGQHVDAGTYLGSVEGTALRERLAAMEQRLAPLELALPLEYGGYAGPSGKKEMVAFSDEALRQAQDKEKSARDALNAASLEEARAGVETRRTLQQHHQGRATLVQVNGAREALAQAKAQVAIAHKHFETVSLHRAVIEAERNRIRSIQAESGLAAVPVAVRIKEYETLKAQRDSLQAQYEASVFFARVPSVVLAVEAKDQTQVEAGQIVMTLRPTHGYILVVKAHVSRLAGASLGLGDLCEVRIPSYSKNALEGTIVSLVPVESGWRKILPEDFRWTQVYIEVPIMRQGSPIAPDMAVSVRHLAAGATGAKSATANAAGANAAGARVDGANASTANIVTGTAIQEEN